MRGTQGQRLVGFGYERQEQDFYKSPYYIIDDLIKMEKIEGSVWENACGDGELSKRLDYFGYNTYSSDKYYRGYGELNDFLENPNYYEVDNIITNPPFNLASEFITTSLSVLPDGGKACFLLKIQFLEGIKRYNELWNNNSQLKKILVYSQRVVCRKNGVGTGSDMSSMMNFAWFVFEKGYNGEVIIDWIPPNKDRSRKEFY